jgi:hypothetical protein
MEQLPEEYQVSESFFGANRFLFFQIVYFSVPRFSRELSLSCGGSV